MIHDSLSSHQYKSKIHRDVVRYFMRKESASSAKDSLRQELWVCLSVLVFYNVHDVDGYHKFNLILTQLFMYGRERSSQGLRKRVLYGRPRRNVVESISLRVRLGYGRGSEF